MLFVAHGLGPGRMDHAVTMFWRAVHGIDPERLVAGIDEIVGCPCGHDHGVVVLYGRLDAVDPDFAATCLDTEELIAIVMRLEADLFSWRERHQYKLEMTAGVEHTAKVVIPLGESFDIANKSFHACLHFRTRAAGA